jgi:hypothetical protein
VHSHFYSLYFIQSIPQLFYAEPPRLNHAHFRANLSILFSFLKDCLLIHSLNQWLISLRSQSLSIRARCRRNQQLTIGPGHAVLRTNLVMFGEVSPDVSLRRCAWCALVVHIAIDRYTQIP